MVQQQNLVSFLGRARLPLLSSLENGLVLQVVAIKKILIERLKLAHTFSVWVCSSRHHHRRLYVQARFTTILD